MIWKSWSVFEGNLAPTSGGAGVRWAIAAVVLLAAIGAVIAIWGTDLLAMAGIAQP